MAAWVASRGWPMKRQSKITRFGLPVLSFVEDANFSLENRILNVERLLIQFVNILHLMGDIMSINTYQHFTWRREWDHLDKLKRYVMHVKRVGTLTMLHYLCTNIQINCSLMCLMIFFLPNLLMFINRIIEMRPNNMCTSKE